MSLEQVEEGLRGIENLRGIDAYEINQWGKQVGEQLGNFKELRGYLHTIVEKISRVHAGCKVAKLRGARPNYDDLVFLESHISYQAARKTNQDERTTLRGLRGILAASLEKIGISQTDEEVVDDLARLNQLFQVVAAYYTEKTRGGRGND